MTGVINPYRYAPPQPFGGLVSTTGLVAYWKFNESSAGSSAVTRSDSHGANHLTDNSPFAASGTGKIANCLTLVRANSEYLSITDNPALSVGSNVDLTITCWAKLASKPGGGSMFILGKDGNTTGTREYDLSYDTATDRFRFHTGRASVTTLDTVTSANLGAVSTGVWYFIAATMDTTGNVIAIQVNNGTADTLAKTIDPPNTGQPFEIGRFTGGLNYWDGDIDEMGVWKRVLNSTELTALYNGGAGLPY
jgi:hypothetical protein